MHYELIKLFLSRRRISHHIIRAAVMVENTSDVGNDAHTPFNPKCLGNIKRKGIRNTTCRTRLRNIDLPAIPIDCKNVVATIWNPTT